MSSSRSMSYYELRARFFFLKGLFQLLTYLYRAQASGRASGRAKKHTRTRTYMRAYTHANTRLGMGLKFKAVGPSLRSVKA